MSGEDEEPVGRRIRWWILTDTSLLVGVELVAGTTRAVMSALDVDARMSASSVVWRTLVVICHDKHRFNFHLPAHTAVISHMWVRCSSVLSSHIYMIGQTLTLLFAQDYLINPLSSSAAEMSKPHASESALINEQAFFISVSSKTDWKTRISFF